MSPRPTLPLVLLALLAAGGCTSKPKAAETNLPVVTVSQPVQREVIDYIDYTGRTDAVFSVDIRPRVTGYLVKMPFKEGSEVKKDDLLFEVDPRPYQAQLDQAQGQVELNKAHLKLAKADNARAKVIAQTPGAISQQDLDTYEAKQEEAQAALDASIANLEVYRLNREFCEVTSPIDGEVSRYYFTLGNLANQDQTLLTTVVSLDPMYAYFDVDERTLLRIRTAINAGKLRPVKNTEEIKVLMGVQGEEGYPHHGVVNFVNNRIDPYTGTITLRGVFENPKPAGGTRLLSPGLFVRVRVPVGDPHPALLVTDRAVGTDQGLKFLYVVDKDDVVQYRRVTLGPLQDDGLRVVAEGLEADDWVVVAGLQQVRPKSPVSPERVPMPIPANEAAVAAGAVPPETSDGKANQASPDEAPQDDGTSSPRGVKSGEKSPPKNAQKAGGTPASDDAQKAGGTPAPHETPAKPSQAAAP